MELVINIVIYIFAFIGLFLTGITIFGKYVIIDKNLNNKKYILNRINESIRYHKK